MRFTSSACALAILLSVAQHAHPQAGNDASPQNYPTRPVRLIVPYPPGGGTDIVARELAPRLVEAWGQQVIIDNRAGAGGTVGHGIAAKSTPDGYTMLLGTSGGLVSTPLSGVPVNYNSVRDFEPIGMVVDIPFVIAVPVALPANNIQELIALSKTRPKGLNFASPGTGTPNHLGAELLKMRTGMRFVHVPYKGDGAAITDLIGGEMQVLLTGIPQLLPHVQSGRLKIIASGHPTRSRLLPDAAPIADTYPGFNSSTWFCLLYPAGTPKALAVKTNAQLNRILTAGEFGKRIEQQGAEPAPGTPQQLLARIQSETERWRKLIKEAGLASGG
jgi:tripartite-type tricarboxylate transporter receptor subunit TctC